MSLRGRRIPIRVLMSLSLLAGLTFAESTGATTSEDTVAHASTATTPEVAAVEILPPDEPWGGATRGEWDARSWQWLFSMPANVNPGSDATGERCGYGQSGPVFFLVGTRGATEITCVVAEGTAIFVRVAGSDCSTTEPPPYFGRTEEELRTCATALVDKITDVPGPRQRAGRRRPRRVSDRFADVHDHPP